MRIHIFVDAENVHIGVFKKGFAYLKHRYEVVKIDIVGKLDSLPKQYKEYNNDSRIRFINCFYGKNSADTFLTAYVLKALYDESLTDCFVIFTQDRDLAVTVKFVTDFGKKVILVSEVNQELSNLKDLGVDMKLVFKLTFEIGRTKHQQYIPYFPIPEPQQKKFVYTPATIYLKTGVGNLIQVHFYNGIDYNLFLNIIPVKKIRCGYSPKFKFIDILNLNYLYVKHNKVYIDLDRLFEGELL